MPRRNILDRLREGDVLVHDGATGTELEVRGVDCETGIWSAAANLEAPDVLRDIHEDYLKAGADIITANNFCTGPSFLNRIGEGPRWKEYSQAGLDIALAARDGISPDAYVAGGICPAGVFGREYTDRARLLANGGSDFILAEYVLSVSDCLGVARACAGIDLPLFLGIGNLSEEGGLADGTSVQTIVSAIKDYRIDGILAMCSLPPAISRFLLPLRDSFSGFIGAYAHGGWASPPPPSANSPQFDSGFPHYTPELLAENAHQWKEMGAQIMGGCCGTGTAHIVSLSAVVR